MLMYAWKFMKGILLPSIQNAWEEYFITMIIGLDHGFGYIKTAHSSFAVNVKEWSVEPPLKTRVLKYDGKYYTFGADRQNVQRDSKVKTPTYYLLTLGAIAEELKYYNRTEANLIIGAGLPLTRFGAEKNEFRQYLLQNSEVSFDYEGKHYKVKISDVRLFPQGYAAIIRDMAKLLAGEQEALLVDMGSWTVDVLPIANNIPNMDKCKSEHLGVIRAIDAIKEEVRRKYGTGISELKIQSIMRGEQVRIDTECHQLIEDAIRRYATEVMTMLRDTYEMAYTPLIICGGGSCIIENFYDYNKEMTTIITDIAANAKGYEYLVGQQEKAKKKQKAQ